VSTSVANTTTVPVCVEGSIDGDGDGVVDTNTTCGIRPYLQKVLDKQTDIAFLTSYMELMTFFSLVFYAIFLYVELHVVAES
jgi:hypothetical protein